MSYPRGVTQIRERDARALLDIVHEGAHATGTAPIPERVLRAIAELVPSDACVGYQEADVSGAFRVVEVLEVVGEPPSRAVEEATREFGWQNPLHCRLHARHDGVLRLSDVLTRRQRRKLEYDAAVWRVHGIDDGLRMWLPAPKGRARSIYVERSGADYTHRERTLFALLRPHLLRMRANVESRRRVAGARGITPREAEILGWLARGMTNAEIARQLFISRHTVRKHVENIFEKLAVHTRTEAAAWVHASAG